MMYLLLSTKLLEELVSPMLKADTYLDPGSGSFILQLILATLLGFLFLLKTYWQKVIGVLKKLFGRDKNTPEE